MELMYFCLSRHLGEKKSKNGVKIGYFAFLFAWIEPIVRKK